MNNELILNVANNIEEFPKKFTMTSWLRPLPTSVSTEYINNFYKKSIDYNCCKTTACIAGWALILSPNLIEITEIPYNKIEDFALTELFDSDQKWKWVFYYDEWPKEWEVKYLHATGSPEQAKIAAELLRSISNNPESFSEHCSLILEEKMST